MVALLNRTRLSAVALGSAIAVVGALLLPTLAPGLFATLGAAGRRAAYRLSVLRQPSEVAAAQPPASVTFTITPTATFPISPFIYGANFLTDDGDSPGGTNSWGGAVFPQGLTLNRMGGNRLSAYNWRLNASNAGRDYRFQNDRFLGGSSTAGEAVRTRMNASLKRGAAMLVTVPMLPFVAGDAEGVELDTLEFTAAERLGKHFVPNRPNRGPADLPRTVYQDEFVRWVATTFPALKTSTATPPMFSLDNEPDAWHGTHQEIVSPVDGKPSLQTYDGFISTSVDFARVIKKELPQAVVFGPALATYTGYLTMGRYPSPDPRQGRRNFLEYYLETVPGRRAT